jgi:hypothetical protein
VQSSCLLTYNYVYSLVQSCVGAYVCECVCVCFYAVGMFFSCFIMQGYRCFYFI